VCQLSSDNFAGKLRHLVEPHFALRSEHTELLNCLQWPWTQTNRVMGKYTRTRWEVLFVIQRPLRRF